MADHIDESYRWCKRLCHRSGSSFCWSFRLLGPQAARSMYALYAFARIADDLADGDNSVEQKRRELDAWSRRVHDLKEETFDGSRQLVRKHPASVVLSAAGALDPAGLVEERLAEFELLWPALQDTLIKFDVPVQLLEEIVQGVCLDIEHQPPKSWEELDRYCYHVAAAVGLACTRIWRAHESMPPQFAIDCGIAFQLTNILRDVANDAGQGRIYIPLSEFERFGVSPVQWMQGEPSGDWEEMIQAVADRAEALYRSGWQTKQFLPPPGQRVFSLMWRYYHELLKQVQRNRHALWQQRRLRVSRVARARLAAQHFISPLYWTLTQPSQ